MRRVVLLPADAEEHAKSKAVSTKAAPIRRKCWLVICWLNLSDIILTAPEVLMRLPCQKALLLLAVSAIACHDSSGPTQPTVFAQFVLNDINGRALPTYLAGTPGLTPTIVSNTLILYKDGTAKTTERRVEWNGVDHTYIWKNTYTRTGIEIEFAYHCPPAAMCIAPPHGKIIGNRLSLDVSGGSGAIIYNYLDSAD